MIPAPMVYPAYMDAAMAARNASRSQPVTTAEARFAFNSGSFAGPCLLRPEIVVVPVDDVFKHILRCQNRMQDEVHFLFHFDFLSAYFFYFDYNKRSK